MSAPKNTPDRVCRVTVSTHSEAGAARRAALLAILFTGCLGALQESAAQSVTERRYRIFDLGTLGGTYSEAFAVNNKGQVAGASLTSDEIDTHAFIWLGAAMQAIPLGGGELAFSEATGINNNGQVVGTFDRGPDDRFGRGFLYDLSTGSVSFPLDPGSARDINDAGQILGDQVLDGRFFSEVIFGSGLTDLGALCSTLCSSDFGVNAFAGKAMNAPGFVLGGPALPPNHQTSYLFMDGSFIPISASAGFFGFAINDSNDIAGTIPEAIPFFGTRSRAAKLTVRRNEDGFIDVGVPQVFRPLDFSRSVIVSAINNAGQIVGAERGTSIASAIAILIENGVTINLNALLPENSGWQLITANDINDRGEIVGSGLINGEEHAYLLTPLVCSSAEDVDGDGNPDDDGDGLCDAWEVRGIDANDDGMIDLSIHTKPDHKDLFVEIDYMVCASGNPPCPTVHSHSPRPAALSAVVNAFAAAPVPNPDGTTGITLHLQVDDAVPEIEPVRFLSDGAGAMDDFNDLKLGTPRQACGADAGGFFGTLLDRAHTNCEAILEARELVFRYAIFGHNHSHLIGSSGIAEIGGNDLMVTLGGWGGAPIRAGGGSADAVKARATAQAATLMHEFGHTLGLRHGGTDHINCKPNYLSVMSYSFQFPSLVSNRPLDYSSVALPAVDENLLDENLGIQGPAGRQTVYQPGRSPVRADADGPIDWNRDGDVTDTAVSQDISNIVRKGPSCATGIKQFLAGFDDWSNLLYSFRHSPDFDDGAVRSTVGFDPELTAAEVLDAAQSFDFDGDTITNFPDNCPAIANPNQADVDANGVGDACEAAATALHIAGSGYNFPEASPYRASFSVDARGPQAPSGSVQYMYTRTRMLLVSDTLSAFTVTGPTVRIEGTGAVNGAAGYGFTATVTDASPDTFAIDIRRPDGTLHFSAGARPLVAGDFQVSVP